MFEYEGFIDIRFIKKEIAIIIRKNAKKFYLILNIINNIITTSIKPIPKISYNDNKAKLIIAVNKTKKIK